MDLAEFDDSRDVEFLDGGAQPHDAIERRLDDIARVLVEVVDAGLEPQYLSPKPMATFVAQDIARWKDVVVKAGVKTD
jgi:tripartite-type tricarboxylate transporter receptor subunit TctC